MDADGFDARGPFPSIAARAQVAMRCGRVVYSGRSGIRPGATETSEVRLDPGAVQQL
jgi:hypothetical protein